MTGAELRELRLALDLSQADLGKLVGRTYQTISEYEREREPIPRVVELACRHLEREPTAAKFG